MDAHLPTEERSTTSDVASTMLAGDIFASTASSDSNGNKLKQIARYIKRLLMCQDSIHKTIDSPIHRVKLRASGVAQFGREVDMDKHVLVSLSVAKACNAILFRTDYSKLCRTLVPNTKLSTLHALQLNTVGLRYLFFPKFRPIRAQTQDGNYIKNETMAKDNKDSLFATIFDLNKIKQLCKSHGTDSSTATITEVGTISNRSKRKRATDDENVLDDAIKQQNSLIKIEEGSISKLLVEIRDIEKTINNINVQVNNFLDDITKKKTLVNERQTLKASMKQKYRAMLEKKRKSWNAKMKKQVFTSHCYQAKMQLKCINTQKR
ncbi:uncharacterized protein RHIMIDRAFT_289052 [Rhizopus microsporus ATCC 52813]|uniref:Uncharacterized protein n=1 Tax=Rhizopus microsporus ATCC 52813 TaxID=1340429 RepID=A0A2G4T593_RHIZD|nr:uncharacterized protein RHIMIDRAFT_289052 [Rhizopus microsporus ATCC 52813]PHZ16194.1 hypothetical protein RHIMIDRAFT_289052 [Rhizopus microsporus ATCC 52813]